MSTTLRSTGQPRKPSLQARMFALACCLITLPAGGDAQAGDVTMSVEPAGAFWLDLPQDDRFTPGFYGAVRPAVSLGPVVRLQWSYAFLFVGANEGFNEAGSAHFLGAGLRLRPFGAKRPDDEQIGGLFADFNLGYVRTGPLDRLGFDTGLGYNFQLGDRVGMGPVLRYGQVIQSDLRANEDPNDAQYITAGLNFTFGSVVDDDTPAPAPVQPAPPPQECPKAPEAPECVPVADTRCPDRDRDGVCDADDRCPNQIGPPATLGCPIDPCSGAPLSVLVQFKYDSAELPLPKEGDEQTMDPVLDAVARAIAQDPSCRVCIIGYSSEEGASDYNLTLSRDRAASVKGYMTARGLASNRMPSTGFGDACQIIPTSSRTLNRRVEFDRLEEGESCPTQCPK